MPNSKASDDIDFPNKRMRCVRCKFEWVSPTAATTCRKCPNMYVQWTNHESWQRQFDALEEGDVTDEYES